MRPVITIRRSAIEHDVTQASSVQVRLAACLGFLSFVLPISALAQAVTPAPLPPDAQAAMKKGVIAAQQQDYLLAIRYFQDARKLAPDAPEIYKDLGLAESKIPGRELRAIAWFGAYLAANPNAPNAEAVRDEIDVLDAKSQSNLSRLIESAQDAANYTTLYKNENFADVAGLWAGTGDMTIALKIVASLPEEFKDEGYEEIAKIQTRTGDISGAKQTADLIQYAFLKSSLQADIAYAQRDAGDIRGALTTADQIKDAGLKTTVQSNIVPNASSQPAVSASTQSAIVTITVSDWLSKLNDTKDWDKCALNTGRFLDLASYLKSLLLSDNPTNNFGFGDLYDAAYQIVIAQNVIDQMLKQQAKQ